MTDGALRREVELTALALPKPLAETRALEIVRAICNRAFFAMGMPQKPIGDLAGVSLLEMLAATELVKNINDRASSVAGGKTFHVIPDDRLVAAAFALENYEHCTGIAGMPVDDAGYEHYRAVHVIQSQAAARRSNG